MPGDGFPSPATAPIHMRHNTPCFSKRPGILRGLLCLLCCEQRQSAAHGAVPERRAPARDLSGAFGGKGLVYLNCRSDMPAGYRELPRGMPAGPRKERSAAVCGFRHESRRRGVWNGRCAGDCFVQGLSWDGDWPCSSCSLRMSVTRTRS